MKTEHTPEPWIVGDDEDSDYCLVGQHDGDGIVYQPVVKLHSEANARRIVACVNACAGIPTEMLERFKAIVGAMDEVSNIEKQRDELMKAMETIAGANAGNTSTTPLIHIAKAAIASVKEKA